METPTYQLQEWSKRSGTAISNIFTPTPNFKIVSKIAMHWGTNYSRNKEVVLKVPALNVRYLSKPPNSFIVSKTTSNLFLTFSNSSAVPKRTMHWRSSNFPQFTQVTSDPEITEGVSTMGSKIILNHISVGLMFAWGVVGEAEEERSCTGYVCPRLDTTARWSGKATLPFSSE